MSAEAIIGQTHVFQVLFVDATNTPIAVLSPEIEVFYYDNLGIKQVVVATTAMTDDVTETGRYVYPYTIPTSFADGDTLYGLMSGINPSTSDSTLVEETVNLVAATRATGGAVTGGLRAQFVKGG